MGQFRNNDPDGNREDILKVATEEFAERGFAGARVNVIAEKTNASKRMIYYYFESKEGLYAAVLKNAFSGLWMTETLAAIRDFPPPEALRRLIEITFDFGERNPLLVRLISIENLQHAKHARQISGLASASQIAIDTLRHIIERGLKDGSFQQEINAVELNLLISSYCFFRISNRDTFDVLFGYDPLDADNRARQRAQVVDCIMAYMATPTAKRRLADHSKDVEYLS